MQNTAPPFSCLAFGLQSCTSPHYLTYWKFQLPLTIRIGSFWIKTYLAARFWMWWLVRDWRGWSEQNIIGSGSHGLYEQGSSKFRQTQQLSKKSGLFWRCTTETMAWGKMAPGFWWDGRAKFYMPSLHGNLHLWTLSTSLCHIDMRFFILQVWNEEVEDAPKSRECGNLLYLSFALAIHRWIQCRMVGSCFYLEITRDPTMQLAVSSIRKVAPGNTLYYISAGPCGNSPSQQHSSMLHTCTV